MSTAFNRDVFNPVLPQQQAPQDLTASQVLANSTTSADLLGLLVGLQRFTGESVPDFLERVHRAAALHRGSDPAGLLNELNLQFGLAPQEAIRIWSAGESFSVECSIAGLVLTTAIETKTIPLLSTDQDGLWTWRMLSSVANDINQMSEIYAILLQDGPCIQLPRQTNVILQVGEAISGQHVRLEQELLPGTEIFNQPVPPYHLNGQYLIFSSAVPEDTTVTYRYRRCPYALLSFPVNVLDLTDPSLASVALTEQNTLVYQAKEYIHRVLDQDRSYWSL